MDEVVKYFERSGFTKDGYMCGKCGKNPLPEVTEFGIVNAKIIVCPHCGCPVKNEIAKKP